MTFRSGRLLRTTALSPLLLASMGLLATPLCHAQQVYKWTDDKGVVNYTTIPPSQRKSTSVDVAPAAAAVGEARSTGEAEYWRARSQREAASELTLERVRRETEELRQAKLRQEIAAAETAAREKTAAQLARDQCRSERRVDCESPAANNWPGSGGYTTASLYPAPQYIIVSRSAAARAPTRPYFSVTPHFTPGYSIPLIYPNPR